MKIFHFKKSIFLIPLLGLLLFLVPSSAFAVGEICADNATCCTPPQSIIDGGGCSSGKYWIGPALGGRCQTNTTTCAATQFSCISGACTGSSTGTTPICNSTQVHIGNNVCKPKLDIYEDSSSVYKMWKGEVLGDPIYMNPSGKVGIGTIGPDATLDVQGTSRIKYGEAGGNTYFEISPESSLNVDIKASLYGTGIAPSMTFQTSGADRLFIKNTGEIGIGTTIPTNKLTLYNGYLGLDSQSDAGSNGIRFTEGGVNKWTIFYRGWDTGNEDLYIRDEGQQNSFMVFKDGTGRVGIGTDAPAARLDVAGEVQLDAQLEIVESSPQIKFTDTDGDDYWIHNNSGRLYFLWDELDDGDWDSPYPLYFEGRSSIFNGGTMKVDGVNNQVGIGTTAPTSPLSVRGGPGVPGSYMTIINGMQTMVMTTIYPSALDVQSSDGTVKFYVDSDGVVEANEVNATRLYSSGQIVGDTNAYIEGDIYANGDIDSDTEVRAWHLLAEGSMNANYDITAGDDVIVGGTLTVNDATGALLDVESETGKLVGCWSSSCTSDAVTSGSTVSKKSIGSTTDRICVLSWTKFRDTDGSGYGKCHVYSSGGNWWVEADSYDNNDSDAECAATCFSW